MKTIIFKRKLGIRIDKFLSAVESLADKTEKRFFDLKITRGEIIRQIKNENILVNGKKVKPSYILKENDDISIIKEQGSMNNIMPNRNIKLEIIYQDENIIVVNKPAGMQVHPVKSLSDHGASLDDTLVNGLLYHFPETESVGEDPMRPGIVHRLDKDTSGVMVVARNQKAFFKLKEKFKNKKVVKKYWAVLVGRMENKKGRIEKSIARSSDYRKQIIAGKKTRTKIREAVTEYKCLKDLNGYCLVEVTPKTGRMHQIRVHMTSIGHSVAGDKKYFFKSKDKNKKVFGRQMLHAKTLEFELEGQKMKFEADLPKDFKEAIKTLTKGK